VSYLRPTAACPTYTEYFKEEDDVPTQLCPVHQGGLDQRVRVAAGNIFAGLGHRLKKLFGH
jgi:hypothetical protein